jgi:hypothetical protein
MEWQKLPPTERNDTTKIVSVCAACPIGAIDAPWGKLVA